jgi:hypothetical protein
VHSKHNFIHKPLLFTVAIDVTMILPIWVVENKSIESEQEVHLKIDKTKYVFSNIRPHHI